MKRFTPTSVLLPLAALALAATLSACGDDTTDAGSTPPSTTSAATEESSSPVDEPTTAETISKDLYVESAGGRCSEFDTLVNDTVAEVGPEGEDAMNQAGADTIAPAYEQHIADLRALGYPEGDEATLEAIYVQQDELVSAFATDMVGVLDGAYADQVAGIATAYDDYGVVACGASPGVEGGGDEAALSHDEFVDAVNGTCADYNQRLDEEGAKVDGSNDSIANYLLTVVVPTLRDEADGIEATGFPVGDEEALQSIVDAQRALADAYEANPVVDDGSAGEELNAQLTDFGLVECAY